MKTEYLPFLITSVVFPLVNCVFILRLLITEPIMTGVSILLPELPVIVTELPVDEEKICVVLTSSKHPKKCIWL